MIGIVVVAHGRFAEVLIETAEMVVGPAEGIKACSFGEENNVDGLRKFVKNSIKDVNDGDGVVILTDMFGGTPSNISLSFLEEGQIEVITGVNLPMMITALSRRQGKDLKALAYALRDGGCSNIHVASELLAGHPEK
jgi:PTS system mannose-specific IIA component